VDYVVSTSSSREKRREVGSVGSPSIHGVDG